MNKTRNIIIPAIAALAAFLALAALSGPSMAQDQPAPAATDGEAPAGNQPVAISFERLLALLQAEADKQNPRAMLTLGNILEGGVSLQNRNYGKALEWYQKAADLDMTEAFYHLGVCYEIGMGTTPDLTKALANYEKASAKGYAPADFKLAVIYLNGAEGVTQDAEKGMRHLNAAADTGLTVALKELGAMYYYGNNNLSKNLTKALEIFGKAAEGGDAESMKNLGAMIISGEGTATDKVEGLKWYLLAQQYGYDMPEMQQTIDKIKGDMTADQISQAVAAAKTWSDAYDAEQKAKEAAAQAAAAAAQEAAQQTRPPAAD
jgi:TPR repeat protein